ncbi:MAG: hypothetical protein VX294_12260 [Candidatus Latescibacterota bacterium]|nr:hypothetical protein [Candidatus Latescibacterota bacterium]
MKKISCFLLFMVLSCGPTPIPLALSHYVTAQEALANDNLEVAQAALVQLSRSAEKSIGILAEKTAAASTIKNVRSAFKNLSNAVIQTQSLPEGFAIAYCPMAFDGNGAQWIQRREPELINPYFGASMLNCGVFKE